MNKPYVKKYDGNGVLTNPIERVYLSTAPNRAARRFSPKKFRGNNKGFSFTIIQGSRYKRVLRVVETIEKTRSGKDVNKTVENNHISRRVIREYVAC